VKALFPVCAEEFADDPDWVRGRPIKVGAQAGDR
jgi:hypothetical protein